jgi:hypothetical protein
MGEGIAPPPSSDTSPSDTSPLPSPTFEQPQQPLTPSKQLTSTPLTPSQLKSTPSKIPAASYMTSSAPSSAPPPTSTTTPTVSLLVDGMTCANCAHA